MSKKFIFVLVGIVFFFGFKFASAEVIFNEIAWMGTSESSANEWIELYSDNNVDLSGWTIVTDDDDISIELSGSIDGFYLVERTDDTTVPNVVANLISTFGHGLSNNGEILILKNSSGNEVGRIDASAGWSAGNSSTKETMQWDGSSWITASPTPKAQNPESGNDTNNNNEEDENSDEDEDSSSDESITETKSTTTPTIKAKILTKTIAFVGLPLEIDNSILRYSNEIIRCGRYFWNFGDGDSIETTNPEKFFHTYFYPGEYVLSLDYYLSTSFPQIPDAKNKIIIKVMPLTVSISKVGDVKDFFIELTNNSNYEIDISKWTLNANGKTFVFPKNSVIMSKKQMTISGKITGFILDDEKNLKLISSTGDLVFDYSSSFSQNEIIAKIPTKISTKNSTVEDESKYFENGETSNEEQTLGNNLSASALLSDTKIKETNNYLFFGIFGILLVGVGIGVYLIRRKKISTNIEDGSDFKILDE